MHKEIATVDQLIDVLGGPTEIGKWLGIKQSAVSNWKLRGEVPPGWHLRLYLAARDRGFSLREGVFGYEPTDRPSRSRVEAPKKNRQTAAVTALR